MPLPDFINYTTDVLTVISVPVGVVVVAWLYLPPILLVWRCLSVYEHFPILNTLAACKASIWPFKPLIFRKQMRLWLELRLLHPKPVLEPRWIFDPKRKRYHLKYDHDAYKDELGKWKGYIRGKFGALKLKEQEPIIEINDVFRLNDDITKDGIKKYLHAVSDLKLSLDEEASFLCKVRINEGYLLPLNLLAGLMARFSEDWDPIISSYGEMATKSFSPLQMTIFDLWLLWGPSVPICTCGQWSGPITMQYGFGDENNSVRVRVENKHKEALLNDIRTAVNAYKTEGYPALHASIVGRLWPPSSFVQGQFCGAQQELLNPDREAFILEYDSHSVVGNTGGGNLFYTAYVWALFVIGREHKPTLDEVRREPWLKVVPFFEHGNIVDDATYAAAKLQLAHKALIFLKNSAQFEHDRSQPPLRLWYVSALDDSGCGCAIAVPPLGLSIRDHIEALLKEPEFDSLAQRIVTNDDSFSAVLSGCHLPEMVSSFFKKIEASRHEETAGNSSGDEQQAKPEVGL